MAKQILDLCALVSTKGRKSSSVGKLASAKMACVIVAFCFATAIAASAQTFNVVYNFDNGPNDPHDNSTVQGRDGYMYSTTPQVWSGQSGDVFKIDPAGAMDELYAFDGTDGGYVAGGLSLALDGNFYGATVNGGSTGFGTRPRRQLLRKCG